MKALKICGKVLLIIVIIVAVIIIIGLLFLKFYPPIGDAPDKDKPFIIECEFDNDWRQLEITRIVNCPTLSVAEVESEEGAEE